MIISFIVLMMRVDKCSHSRYIDYLIVGEHALRRWWIEFLSIYTIILRRYRRAIITTDTSNVLKEISKAKFYFSLCYRY